MHHNPCFDYFILHNNSFDNQGSEINKKKICLRFFTHFLRFVFHKIFLPIYIYIYIYMYVYIYINYIYIYTNYIYIYIYIP